MIDQFAAAEGRMKWAPNKKLHFEVALIKAIQTLNQVTLNEVIENLNALRDGKAVAGSASPIGDSPSTARTGEPDRPKWSAKAAADNGRTVAGGADLGRH